MTGKIFISYRNKSSKWQALSIFHALRFGFNRDIFIDKMGLTSGDWWETLLKAIEAHRHFVVILSKGSLNFDTGGSWFREEIKHALKHKRNIVPVQFEDFNLNSSANKLALARYKLAKLRDKEAITVTSKNFETDVIRLNALLAGHTDIKERPLPKTIKKKLYLEIKNNYSLAQGDGGSELDSILSKTKTSNARVQKDIDLLKQGTSPYIGAVSDSLGIGLSNLRELRVKAEIIPDDVGEKWFGLAISNLESQDIAKAYVELRSVFAIQKSRLEGPLEKEPKARFGWSSVYKPTDEFVRIPKGGTKKIDILRTLLSENLFALTGVNGKRLMKLNKGKYLVVIQIHGTVSGIERIPKMLGLVAEFSEGKNLALEFLSQGFMLHQAIQRGT